MLAGFLFLLLLLCPGESLRAEPELKVQLEPVQKVKEGGVAHFTLHASWPTSEADYRFILPEINLEGLVLEDRAEASETIQKEGETWQKKTFRFTLKGSRAGKGRISGFRLTYVDPVTQKAGHFDVAARDIQILPDRTGLIRVTMAIGGIFLTGIGVRSLFVIRTRRKREKASVPLPPLEEYFASEFSQLENLARNGAFGHNDIFRAGKLFRNYLIEKHTLVVPGSPTTAELLARLKESLSVDEWKVLKRILESLDEYRYADLAGQRDECRELCREITSYVEGKKIITA